MKSWHPALVRKAGTYMLKLSRATTCAAALFTAVSTAVMMTGCGTAGARSAASETKLLDDNGETYTLRQNKDGTETAVYSDGRKVTFQKDADGDLQFVSGSSWLLPALAMGYFLSKGIPLQPNAGYYDAERRLYVRGPRVPGQQQQQQQQQQQSSSGGGGGAYYSGSWHNHSRQNSGNGMKPAVTSGGKTGFGGAGVRSGAS